MNIGPLLIDTNLLVLYVVGTASREYIAKHKRLSAYTVQDYDLLITIINAASDVLVTPNTLTETSNLSAFIGEPAKGKIFAVLEKVVACSKEVYVPSKSVVGQQVFLKLGLTDSVLVNVTGDMTLLTTDFDLYQVALHKGVRAENFHHLRSSYLRL